MKLEQKNGLGRVIRQCREARNFTQDRLAGAAGIDLRTVQRAEAGQGISSENRSAIANALGLDEAELLKMAAEAGPTPPEIRIRLKQLKSSEDLIKIFQRVASKHLSLEIAPPGEDRFNDVIGDHLIALSDEVDVEVSDMRHKQQSKNCAQHILDTCRATGFGLFANSYTEEINHKNGSKKKKTIMLMFAAPLSDPRIKKSTKGLELDVLRDSRRLLYGQFMSGPTFYDWAEDQLLGKSNGEETVRSTLRRMMAQIRAEGR